MRRPPGAGAVCSEGLAFDGISAPVGVFSAKCPAALRLGEVSFTVPGVFVHAACSLAS
jgi:hypothetical protein